MAPQPFLSELRLFACDFAPQGWAQCNGQLLPINQNQALYSLLGTTYGGDGRTNFALPNLRGRTPMHDDAGSNVNLGDRLGEEAHTLALAELPAHAHVAQASATNADQPIPSILAAANNLYHDATNLVSIHPQTIASAGGGQPHENRHPFLALNWCIALQGIFP